MKHCAHIDHSASENNIIFNGADDNASGSASVLELARVISQNPLKHSVIFTLFSSEELGSLGAHFFERASDQNRLITETFPLF